MMTRQRRAAIAARVRREGSVRVSDLAHHFGVSDVTIRNDLAELELQNVLLRDHGGAIRLAGREITSLMAIEKRSKLQTAEKRRIASEAASRVRPGDTILLDAGTTVIEMCRFLENVSPLTIVTYGVNVAMAASCETSAEVILLGGNLNRESASNLGPMTERAFADLIVDKLFMGTQAVDFDHGLTDTSVNIAQIKRAMIRAAKTVTLMVDSTKWNTSGFIKVVPITAANTIITDKAAPKDIDPALQKLGIPLTRV